MKRLAFAAVVMSVVACNAQEDTPIADTTTVAPAMAPAPSMDTTMMDTTVMTDTLPIDTTTPPPAQ